MNRVVRAGCNGFELEGDPRHAELVIEQLDLLGKSKSVTTPGVDDADEDSEEAETMLDAAGSSAYRTLAARCDYLSSDRPDILYPVKELCREMSSPTNRSWKRLKRVGR